MYVRVHFCTVCPEYGSREHYQSHYYTVTDISWTILNIYAIANGLRRLEKSVLFIKLILK